MVGIMCAFSSLCKRVRTSAHLSEYLTIGRERERERERERYELFDEVHLLSLQSITENRLLFLDYGIGSRSERQSGTKQRLEEHDCREVVLKSAKLFCSKQKQVEPAIANMNSGCFNGMVIPCSRALPAQAPMSIYRLTSPKHHSFLLMRHVSFLIGFRFRSGKPNSEQVSNKGKACSNLFLVFI